MDAPIHSYFTRHLGLKEVTCKFYYSGAFSSPYFLSLYDRQLETKMKWHMTEVELGTP